jgi:hypothetical protein
MDTRRHLVEEWKAKLEASSHPLVESGERFAWVRQIYTRIYRFLVSCYGEGEWRGAGDESNLNADSPSTASRMPFVEHCSTTDGLAPKSPERIRAALESIHSSNPGIATPGTTVGVEDDSWIVVAAQRKPKFARAVHRRLVACGIEARLLDRTTDKAVVVRYEDFDRALVAIQKVGGPAQIRLGKRIDPKGAVGTVLLISTACTFLAIALTTDAMISNVPIALFAAWIAAVASGWLFFRGRKLR